MVTESWLPQVDRTLRHGAKLAVLSLRNNSRYLSILQKDEVKKLRLPKRHGAKICESLETLYVVTVITSSQT